MSVKIILYTNYRQIVGSKYIEIKLFPPISGG